MAYCIIEYPVKIGESVLDSCKLYQTYTTKFFAFLILSYVDAHGLLDFTLE